MAKNWQNHAKRSALKRKGKGAETEAKALRTSKG